MNVRAITVLSLAILAASAFAEPDDRAPRSDSGKPNLADKDIAGVSQEFDLATRRREHWAWQPVQSPSPPLTGDRAWAADAIDRFVLVGLESAGIAPALPAEKNILIRRAYFDLIGLPPTANEVEAFERDDAPDAFEKVVDRLLASPHFGERWGRHWLDLVRYAETRGHEYDHIIPNAFQYRDYVIRALNADVPYDQFVTEHIAGDLVQPPRLHLTDGFNESILGTGFWCLGEELHSPVDIRGDETDRIDNKIDVFSKTFLGLTVACARCHDHKFDAISMRDYYGLAGFLLSSSYRQAPFESMEVNRCVAREVESLEDRFRPGVCQAVAASQRPAVAQVARYLPAAREAIQSNMPGASARIDTSPAIDEIATQRQLDPERLRRWVDAIEKGRQDSENPLYLWSLIAQSADKDDGDRFQTIVRTYANECESQAERVAASWKDTRFILDFSKPDAEAWNQDGIAFGLRPVRAGDVRFSADPARPIAQVFQFAAARSDPSWDVVQLAAETERDPGKVSWPQSGRTLRTRTITLSSGKLYYLVCGAGQAYASVDSHRLIAGPLHGALTQSWDAAAAGRLQWVEHDLSSYQGHRVHIEFSPKEIDSGGVPRPTELAILAVVEADRVPCDPVSPSVAFSRRLTEGRSVTPHTIAQAYESTLLDTIDRFGAGTIIGSPDAECTAWLANWMIQHPELFLVREAERAEHISQAARPFFEQAAATKARLRRVSQTAPALLDGSGVDEYVLHRGNHRSPGAVASRRFLEAVGFAPAVHEAVGSGRLELARQVTDPTDPLVARVMVNRVWHYLFGRGIVASVDNFGALGERPTHPELLDYLAHQFMEQGWSMKRLIRRIMLSSTYQMSAQPRPSAMAVDPENLRMHHLPVRRLEGEAIRDAILAIAGRFDATMFGPSVEVRLTPFMEGRGRPAASGPVDGDGRRSVYLRVRRNFLHPMLMAFDAPTPCTTIGRRSVSNVPAQALSLMNNEFVIAQANRWAREVVREHAAPQQRVQQMFLAAFARRCSPDELNDVLQFIADERDRYNGASDADARPWENLAHVLLNAKEFIFIQ